MHAHTIRHLSNGSEADCCRYSCPRHGHRNFLTFKISKETATKQQNWASAGGVQAFVIALYAEMYGFPDDRMAGRLMEL